MNLDLRIPMGLMFTLVGAILTVQGLLTRGSVMYEKSVGIDINLDWGVVMLIFGVSMFLLGRRAQKNLPPPPTEGTSRPLGHGHGH
jgi:hypothetical protein